MAWATLRLAPPLAWGELGRLGWRAAVVAAAAAAAVAAAVCFLAWRGVQASLSVAMGCTPAVPWQ